MPSETVIREAVSAEDYEAFGRVVRAYVDWCRERYRREPWFVEMTFGYQSLERELEHLADSYGPPNGKTLLAFGGGDVQGGVAYRRLSDAICEMKRLFVLGEYAGRGIGRRLCEALIGEAAADGYSAMRLDTSRDMHEAIALYKSMGFVPCAPYVDYPERLKPMISFMERPLARARATAP